MWRSDRGVTRRQEMRHVRDFNVPHMADVHSPFTLGLYLISSALMNLFFLVG